MTIAVGDRLPDATFTVMGDSGPETRTTAETFGGRKILLFGVPGAFTPACHRNHMPGYVEQADTLRARGIDAVACVAVNDVFVLDQWAKTSQAVGKIEMLADGNADFARAAGLEIDISAKGLGVRSKRFAMVVEDGVVTALEIEPEAGAVSNSSAAEMLAKL